MKLIDSGASEEVLWEAIKRGDELAFKIIFKRYVPVLLATSRHYLRDEESCENVVQNIFLQIWFKRETLVIRDLKSYLTASARYEVYRVLKERKKLDSIVFLGEVLEEAGGYCTNQAEESFNVAELKAQLSGYLQALPNRCREIFLLSRQEHLSNSEIATKLNISKRSVENQITAALQYLRLNMKDYTQINLSVIISLLIAFWE